MEWDFPEARGRERKDNKNVESLATGMERLILLQMLKQNKCVRGFKHCTFLHSSVEFTQFSIFCYSVGGWAAYAFQKFGTVIHTSQCCQSRWQEFLNMASKTCGVTR